MKMLYRFIARAGMWFYILFLTACGTMHKIVNTKMDHRDTSAVVISDRIFHSSEKVDTLIHLHGDTLTGSFHFHPTLDDNKEFNGGELDKLIFSDSLESGDQKIILKINNGKITTTAINKPKEIPVQISRESSGNEKNSTTTKGSETHKEEYKDVKRINFLPFIILIVILIIIISLILKYKSKLMKIFFPLFVMALLLMAAPALKAQTLPDTLITLDQDLQVKTFHKKAHGFLKQGEAYSHTEFSQIKRSHKVILNQHPDGRISGHIFFKNSDSCYVLKRQGGGRKVWAKVSKDIVLCDTLPAAIPPGPYQYEAIAGAPPIPLINTYPGSDNVVMVDLDGFILNNKNWSDSTVNETAPNLTPAQDWEIMNRIGEKYRGININFTTDEKVFYAASPAKRFRIVVTSNSAWYGSAGGVAYVGAWGLDTLYGPAHVFSNMLANNPEYIAEAAAHEIGHVFGLQHHGQFNSLCQKVSSYYSGHGSGIFGWGAMMGAPYGFQFVLMACGATTNATCYASPIQDDFKIITTTNGATLTYKKDDIGNTIGTARAEPFTNNMANDSGIIERSDMAYSDTDVVKVLIPSGQNVTFNVNPYSIGNNGTCLLPRLRLYDALGNLVAVDTPQTISISHTFTNLPSGLYFAQITSRGFSTFTDSGYTKKLNYGSCGKWYFKATLAPIVQPPPCTVPTLVINPSSATITVGGSVALTASGATTYSWNPASGLNTATLGNVNASPTITTTYTITGYNTAACTASKAIIITVNPVPPPPVTYPVPTGITLKPESAYPGTILCSWANMPNAISYTFTFKDAQKGQVLQALTVPAGILGIRMAAPTKGDSYLFTIKANYSGGSSANVNGPYATPF